MLLKYNTDTERFDLKGLTIDDLATLGSGMKMAGEFGKPQKKMSKLLRSLIDGLGKKVKEL